MHRTTHLLRGARRFVFLTQVVTTTLSSQVIIRDTVYITPTQPTPSSSVGSIISTFRVEFSYTGVVDQSFAGYNILVAAHRYCPISQQVSLNSGTGAVEVEAAAGGWYNVRARLAFPYGSTGVAKLVYQLDGEVLQVDSTVISCTNIAGCAIDWRPTVVFYPGMTVATGSGSILHGQSTTLSVSPVASPFFCARGGAVWHPGYPVTVSVVAGSSYGSFVDVTTGETLGTSFKRKVAQLNAVRYIANGEQPQGEQDTVRIQAEANGVMGMRSVVVRRTAPLLDHFAVAVEKDTIAFTESATIVVQAKDANDNNIDPPADTKVNIVLRADERYGNLAYKSIVGKEMINVPYGDANSGQVVFVATGENPIGLEPQKVDVGVTGLGKEGVSSVWVKCKIDPPRYAQGGDSPWADDHYDDAYDKEGNEINIRTLGCALSCMAMAMTAFGDTVSPGELNTWMKMAPKDSGGYRGRSVNWRAISLHSPSKKIYGADAKNVGVDFDLSTFDSFLDKCELIIAKVFNPKSVENASAERRAEAEKEGNHWVLITKKIGNDYTILDPGRGLNLLSGYGRIYRYVRIFK